VEGVKRPVMLSEAKRSICIWLLENKQLQILRCAQNDRFFMVSGRPTVDGMSDCSE